MISPKIESSDTCSEPRDGVSIARSVRIYARTVPTIETELLRRAEVKIPSKKAYLALEGTPSLIRRSALGSPASLTRETRGLSRETQPFRRATNGAMLCLRVNACGPRGPSQVRCKVLRNLIRSNPIRLSAAPLEVRIRGSRRDEDALDAMLP